MFCKKKENTDTGVNFLNKVTGLRSATLLKEETPIQVFSCEFCEIFKNTFFCRTPPVAVSAGRQANTSLCITVKLFGFI